MSAGPPQDLGPARAAFSELLGDVRAWFEWATLTGLEDWPVESAPEAPVAVAGQRAARAPTGDARPPTVPRPPPRAAGTRDSSGFSSAAPVVASVLQRVRPAAAQPPAESLEIVRADVGPQCKRCTLCQGRRRVVFGSGPSTTAIMVVGDFPGPHDDETGEAWLGDEGPLLTRMLRAIGHARSTVFVTHLVKCRPSGGRAPTSAELSACLPFVERQLRALQPAVVLAVGPLAARALSGRREALPNLRGQDLVWGGVPLVVTYDPAILLTAPQLKREAWDDLRRARDIVKASA